MVTRRPRDALLGRRHEREVLDGLLAAALGGQSGVLVVVGESGIGKTALLEYAIESAPAFRVARAGGVEWEMELPFATGRPQGAGRGDPSRGRCRSPRMAPRAGDARS